MRLRILGSSGGYPGPDNPCSGYLLEHGTARIWLDAGSGTFSALQRVADFTRLDAIFISHAHADHCADLLSVFIALRYREEGVLRMPLYCHQEVWDRVPRLLADLPEADATFREVFDFHPLEERSVVEVGGVRARFLRTDHPNTTLASRFETGSGVLTFSADTGPGADLGAFARGSDLLLCEATYQEARQGAPVHLTARQAGETARRAGVPDLLLTHFWPPHDRAVTLAEAQAAAGGVRVRLATPGAGFDVRDPDRH